KARAQTFNRLWDDSDHQAGPAALIREERGVAAAPAAADLDEPAIGHTGVLEQSNDDAVLLVLRPQPESPRGEVVRWRQRQPRQMQRPQHRVHLPRKDDAPFAFALDLVLQRVEGVLPPFLHALAGSRRVVMLAPR